MRNRTQRTGGLLVLDAHRNPIDIFATAVWIRRMYNPNVLIIPIAGYLGFTPLLGGMIRWFAKKYRIMIMPVYRLSDHTTTSPMTRSLAFWYPTTLTQHSRKKANDLYLSTALSQLHKKQCVVLVSPFGGYGWYGMRVKSGVLAMLRVYPHTLLTLSRLGVGRIQTNHTEYLHTDSDADAVKTSLLAQYLAL